MLYLARKSKEEKMEASYNLFKECNWDLTNFKNDTDLFIEELRSNAREYALNVLEETLTKEQIWCLMPTSVRLMFNNHSTIIGQMLKENVITSQQLMDIDWNINNLKKIIYKFCFDVCEKFKWINIEIDEYCNRFSISPNSLKSLAREYGLEILNWDKESQEEHWNKKVTYRKNYNFDNLNQNSGFFANLFVRVANATNDSEVIKKFVESNKEYQSIKHGLINFVSAYKIPEDMKEDLFKKLDVYKEYLKSYRKQLQNEEKIKQYDEFLENNFEQAKKIITEYINSECFTIEEYCNNIGLDKKIFDKYLELVKDNEEILYERYIQHIEKIKEDSHNKLLSNSLTVINLMKNGVVENNVKREFDLVDYYKYLPIGFDRMLRLVREDLNVDDYKMLSTYVSKVKNDKELSESEINNIYNTKTIIGVQLDEEGKVIPGTGREITKEEKENIINYLKTNNIPVTNKTYNIIYRRWLSGDLVIEEKHKIK